MPMTSERIQTLSETSPQIPGLARVLSSLPSPSASSELCRLSGAWRKLAKDCEALSVAATYGHSPSSSAR